MENVQRCLDDLRHRAAALPSNVGWRSISALLLVPLLLLLVLHLLPASPYLGIFNFQSAPSPPWSGLAPAPTYSSLPPAAADVGAGQKVAICLVGGARKFELTGPSIVNNLLTTLPTADVFLHIPLDGDSYKLSLLHSAPKITLVKIFQPDVIEETPFRKKVLTTLGSPKGLQGILQYFRLVEGCETMIEAHEKRRNFTYDWIIRTRVDGYWSAALDVSAAFVPGVYVIPVGAEYGGVNDRFGVGDRATSKVANSRLSFIGKLQASGFAGSVNSEAAFKAQLTTANVKYRTMRVPFCVLTQRSFFYPPHGWDTPVASFVSPVPLSGIYCRPCTVACAGKCAATVMKTLRHGWCWAEWGDGSMELCNAAGPWENGWENVFDRLAGEEAAKARVKMGKMDVQMCVEEMQKLRSVTAAWEAPEPAEICRLGFVRKKV